MTDPRDEITRIIEKTQYDAYQRGWRDAFAAITEAAEQLKGHEPNPDEPHMVPGVTIARIAPRRTGRPASKAIQVVEECIIATPGLKGTDVVKAAQSVDGSIKERTVRTCLRRLRLNKSIWKRNGLWYPKAKEKLASENGSGETVGSPPH